MNSHYAYGPERAGIEAIMRLQAVTRWHMISTSKEQTLGEHTANVSLLAYYIAKTAPGMFFDDASVIAVVGLLHDLPEVYVGDVPTHTKQYLSGIKELERRLIPPVFTMQAAPRDKALVKLCDLADGIRYVRLHGIDVTAKHAQAGLESQLMHLLSVAFNEWPREVFEVTMDAILFYAYENSPAFEGAKEWDA